MDQEQSSGGQEEPKRAEIGEQSTWTRRASTSSIPERRRRAAEAAPDEGVRQLPTSLSNAHDLRPGSFPDGHPMSRVRSSADLNQIAWLTAKVDLLERQVAALIAASPSAARTAVADAISRIPSSATLNTVASLAALGGGGGGGEDEQQQQARTTGASPPRSSLQLPPRPPSLHALSLHHSSSTPTLAETARPPLGEPVPSSDGGIVSEGQQQQQQRQQQEGDKNKAAATTTTTTSTSTSTSSAAAAPAPSSSPSHLPPQRVPSPVPFEPVPMAATRVVLHQLVTPSLVDDLGICSGGAVLSWIDVAAGLAAKTLARGPVVTASVDAVAFLRPARRGSVAIVAAMVNRVFRSSAEVGVRVEEEVLATGERRHCCSAYLTFVSVGRAGVAPVAVMPPVAPADAAQAEVFAAAERRRAERLAARARARDDPEALPPRLKPVTHRGGAPTLAPPILALSSPSSRPSSSGRRKKKSERTTTKGDEKAEEEEKNKKTLESLATTALTSSLYSPTPSPFFAPALQPRKIPPAATLSHMTQLILPQHANSLGITFGGVVLNWVEQCAHIAGARAGRCLGNSGAFNNSQSHGSGNSNSMNNNNSDDDDSEGDEDFSGEGGLALATTTTTRVLTAGMDSVAFGAPTRVGDVLYVSAQVTAVWGASMEVMVSVCAETPSLGGRVFECGDAFVTVVAVDGKTGRPIGNSSGVGSGEEGNGTTTSSSSGGEKTQNQEQFCFLDIPSDPASPDARRFAGAAERREARLTMRRALLAHERRRPSLDGRPMVVAAAGAAACAARPVPPA